MRYFYAHLFGTEPEISAMFPVAMDAQRRRLYESLLKIVTMPRDPVSGQPDADGDLTRYLADLGRAHRKYGVRKEHYGAFRSALRLAAGRFTPRGAAATDGDYWVAALDRAMGIMLVAADEDAAQAPAWWTAEVTRHELRTPQVAVLTVQPSEPFAYEPGQHLHVQTPRWPREWRTYSIANAPRADGSITLHVRAIGGGLVSTTLVHHLEPGDMLLVGRAEGGMTVDTGSQRPVLCLAGGTGLAPLKAIAEAMTATGTRREIVLYHGARTESELYDLPALRQMELDFPWLEVIPATSHGRAEGAKYGMIPVLATRADWEHRDVYISGPDAMIRKTVESLRALGAPAALLHYDLPEESGAVI
jgi:NAD(P)H-flavin reductase/hemoglobin-like flavoprotein